MKLSTYKQFIEALGNSDPMWPVTFVLKNGMQLETLASELIAEECETDFSIFVENVPHRGTAHFDLEDVMCILS